MKEVQIVSRIESSVDGGSSTVCSVWEAHENVDLIIRMLMPGLRRFYKLTQWYKWRVWAKEVWSINGEFFHACDLEVNANYDDITSFQRVAWSRLVYGNLVAKIDPEMAVEPWNKFELHEYYSYNIKKMPIIGYKGIE